MNGRKRPGRINVRLLVILVVAMVLLVGGAAAAYKVRKRVIASRALAAGKAALEKEDWPEACKQLRRYLVRYPDNPELLARYAEANLAVRPLEQGHVGAALAAYRRLCRLSPGDSEPATKLTELYLQIGDYGEAAHFSRKRLEADPDDAAAGLTLSRALIPQRKFAAALEPLERLLENRPGDVEPYVILSVIAERDDSAEVQDAIVQLLGERAGPGPHTGPQLALGMLTLGLEHNPESALLLVRRGRLKRLHLGPQSGARTDLQAASDQRSTDPNVLLALQDEWLRLGDLEQAEAQWRALEALTADDLERHDVDPDALLMPKFEAATRLVTLKQDATAALALAERVVSEPPAYTRPFLLPLAVQLYLVGDDTDSAKRFLGEWQDAIAEQGEPTPEQRNRAVFLDASIARAEKRNHDVIRQLEPLVLVNREYQEAWRLLARAYDLTGQVRREVRLLEEYLTRWPDDAQASAQLSRAYMRLGRWAEALDYARVTETASPGSPDGKLLKLQAGTYAALEKAATPKALEHLRRELEDLAAANPRPAVRMLQARVAVRQQRIDDAIALLNQAIDDSEDPTPAAIQLADLYDRTDQQDKAIAVCQAAIKKRSDKVRLRLELARLQLADDQPGEARNTIVQAVEQLTGEEHKLAEYALARYMLVNDQRPEALALLEKLVSEHPDDLRMRLALLELLEIQSDPARAQQLVDEVKRIESENGLNWRVEQARLWLGQDNWQDRRQEIVDLLTYCMERDPGWSRPVLALGYTHERLGDSTKAEAVYRDFVDAYPRNFDVVSRLLSLLERQQRFAEASAILERVPQDFLEMDLHRLNVALGTGDYPSAIEELERQITDSPQNAVSRTLLARVLYAQNRDATASLKLLDEVLETDPDQMAAVTTKVWILHNEDRRQEARALVDAEVARRNDFASHLLRAEYLMFVEEHDLAEQDFLHLNTFPDSTAQGYFALGRYYLRLGRVDPAINAWSQGLEAVPDNPALQRYLVSILVTHKDPQQRRRGTDLLNELLGESPDDPVFLFAQARALLNEGGPEQSEQAQTILERVVRKSPRNVEAHLLLIQLAGGRADLIQARDLIVRALGSNPGHNDLLLAQAALENDSGNASAARQLAGLVLDRAPENIRALHLLADLQLRARDIAAAEALINQAIELDPDNEMSQLMRVRILITRGELDQAIQVLDGYCNSPAGEKSLNAWLTLADLYIRNNDAQEAQRLADVAEQLDPGAMGVELTRMRCWAAEQHFDKLISHVEQAILDDPSRSPILLVGAALLTEGGDKSRLEAARRFCRKAVEMNPGSTAALLNLAQITYLQGDLEGARGIYNQILQLEPFHQRALNDAAWIIGEELGNPEEGLQFADKGVRRYPGDPHLRDTRGVLLTRLKRFDAARTDLEEAIQLATGIPGTHAKALFHLGRVYSLQGEDDKARQKLNEALAMDPQGEIFSSDERAEIAALLNSIASARPVGSN